MATGALRIEPHRVPFRGTLTASEIDALVEDSKIRVLQTSEPVPSTVWSLLNDSFFARRPDVELRVFGFYSSRCDLGFLSRMSHVRRFAADCLLDADGVEHIAEMPHLEHLSIDIFSLTSFDVLRDVNPNLRSLSLGKTRSKQPDLALLSRFDKLERIFLDGHRKNIEVISNLRQLEDVTLRSVTTPNLGYLTPLPKLCSLDVKLGGIRDLSAIAGKSGLKYLELWQVQGLEDVGVIGELAGLQNLSLQSLRQVEALPDLHSAAHLRRVTLDNMKGLHSLTVLEHAPVLEELIVTDAGHMQPDDLEPALRNRALRRALIGLGSARKNQQVAELMAQLGIARYERAEFNYR